MASDVIRLYISLISQFFTLSDMAVTSPKADSVVGGVIISFPPFVPQRAHALTSGHYLTRVLSEIQDCVNEIIAMDISSDVNSGVRGLLESARWRFEGALTNVWLRGLIILTPTLRLGSNSAHVLHKQTRTFSTTSRRGLLTRRTKRLLSILT